MKKPARLLALTATLVLLGACAGGPEKPAPAVATPVAQTNTESAAPGDEVERLLDRATRASPADAARLRLDAAELLSERRDPVSAREILAALDTDRLPPQMRARAALLGARIALGEGDAVRALALLGEPETGWMQTGLPRSLQVALAQTRADVLLALNRPLDAAAARVAIHPWLASEDERRENALATLAALSRAPLAQIERAAATASTEDWRGWLQLSAIIRDMRFPPGRQLERLQDWQQRYAGIPALDTASSQVLPRFREHLAQPARVALLLPLSGRNAPSGRAVLQGFAAEHFSQLGYGGTTPTIAVIDTAAAAGGFPGAYRGAIEDGATVVIGPLLKEELAALADGSLHAAVPTLALNFLDTPSAPQPNLYQFGIDVADEVAQLVIEARARGYRHAVALADTAPRARRQADDFAGRWRDAGGELLGTLYLDDLNDYREALEDTLLLEQSAARTAALTHLLGLTLQSEPRRRADLGQ